MSGMMAEGAPSVRAYVDGYEFRGDAGDHTPSEAERVMIEDAIEGFLATIQTCHALLPRAMTRDEIDALAGQMAAPGPVMRVDDPLRPAIRDIAIERCRQIEAEGWSPDHDDRHRKSEIAFAAATYVIAATLSPSQRESVTSPCSLENNATLRRLWPWDQAWWKPTNRRRDLVKAGALIVAEIERLDRAAAKAGAAS